ncbi:MAG: hypothetical protein ACJ74Z_01935 [Bryobacteraceae bacterium]
MGLSARPLYADRPGDVLRAINHVALALADDNATDAMTPFDKSFAKYAKLRDYFSGLTDSSQLVNEVDIIDQQDAGNQSNVTLQWTLTLINRSTLQSERRSAEIHVRLNFEGGKWKIVDFSPIDLFNPQSKQRLR